MAMQIGTRVKDIHGRTGRVVSVEHPVTPDQDYPAVEWDAGGRSQVFAGTLTKTTVPHDLESVTDEILCLAPPGNAASVGEIAGVRVSRHACSYRVGPNHDPAFCVEDAAALVVQMAGLA